MRYVNLVLATVVAITISLFPVLWLISAALRPTSDIVKYPDKLVTGTYTLENFRRVLSETRFLDGLANSLVVAAITVFLVITTACTLFLLTRLMPPRWKRRTEAYVLVAYVFPPIIMIIPLYVFLSRASELPSLFGLVWAHSAYLLPFAYWVLQDRLSSVSDAVFEALSCDGASGLELVRYGWMPVVRPAVLAAASLVFVVSMNDYVMAQFVVKSTTPTLPLVLKGIFDRPDNDWALMLASGAVAVAILTIPVVLLRAFSGKSYFGGSRS